MIPLQQTTWEYWDQLRKAWRGVRHDFDAASIHDLRSASRRVVSALLLLEAAAGIGHTPKARRRIKRLIKRLGLLRDVQVQISIVEKWKGSGATGRFLNSLKALETKERRSVRHYLTGDRKQKFHRSLKAFERDVEKYLRKRPLKSIQTEIKIALNAQRQALSNARKSGSSEPESLHLLRTTARKLRYCLEAAASTIGPAPKSESQRLRRYQTELGRQRDLQIVKDEFEQWCRKNGRSPRSSIGPSLRQPPR